MASLLKSIATTAKYNTDHRTAQLDAYMVARRELPELESKLKDIADTKNRLETERRALDDLVAWCSEPYNLEQAKNSAIHRFNSSARFNFGEIGVEQYFPSLRAEKFHCFVLEHNLAAAFKGADGFDDGEFQLPYDNMIFEFQVSGKRVMLVVINTAKANSDLGRVLLCYAETASAWLGSKMPARVLDDGTFQLADEEPFLELIKFLWPQVRATCIALEAEVVAEEIVRAPHALNRAREKLGKPLLVDYSVIKLLHRKRYQPLDGQHTAHGRHRFHFVRGHWRHYETHKTWVKWHMRGDIDLGIVEKEYRL